MSSSLVYQHVYIPGSILFWLWRRVPKENPQRPTLDRMPNGFANLFKLNIFVCLMGRQLQ